MKPTSFEKLQMNEEIKVLSKSVKSFETQLSVGSVIINFSISSILNVDI